MTKTNSTISSWVKAARLRTLPLAISGIITGSFLAGDKFQYTLFVCMLLTAAFLQILSNFANDLGDYQKGADHNRKGEARMVTSGAISPLAMQIAVGLLSLISAISAFLVIHFAQLQSADYFFFIGLAVLAILAAITYTVGKKAYGYSGFGDVFVLLFFGFVSVMGSHFIMTKTFDWHLIFPALGIGCFSTAVLNLNNLRDFHTDKEVGKRTLVVKLGFEKAKNYHALLLWIAYFSIVDYAYLTSFWFLLPLATLPLGLKLLRTVKQCQEPAQLDGELKKQALLTLITALLIATSSFIHFH